MLDTGRDRGGIEPVEYCDNLFLDTCDIGRERLERRTGGDVASGVEVDWLGDGCAGFEGVEVEVAVVAVVDVGLEVAELLKVVGGGEVAGDGDEGDTIVVIIGSGK